jgi:hypothetical protein
MLRHAPTFAVAAVLAATGVPACSSDDEKKPEGDAGTTRPPPAQQDAGFEGVTASVDGVMVSYTQQRTAYASSAGDLTTIRAFLGAAPANAGEGFVLTLDAETAGKYPCAVPGATLAFYKDDGASPVRFGALVSIDGGPPSGSCTITIDTYGGLGDVIEGSFEGTLPRVVGPAAAPAQVVVTNGRFRIRRASDE